MVGDVLTRLALHSLFLSCSRRMACWLSAAVGAHRVYSWSAFATSAAPSMKHVYCKFPVAFGFRSGIDLVVSVLA